MKHAEMCEKRIKEANEHLAWFDLDIALYVYAPEEIIEKKNWWKADRDWWQKELDISVEVDMMPHPETFTITNKVTGEEKKRFIKGKDGFS